MALNIKNVEVELLAAEVAGITGETKTEAILQALRQRKQRLMPPEERRRKLETAMKWLEEEVWPSVPEEVRGKGISNHEQERILGFESPTSNHGD